MARIVSNATAEDFAAQLAKLKKDLVELGRVVGETADKEKKYVADSLLQQARGAVDYLSSHASTVGDRAADLRKESAAFASRLGDSVSENYDDLAEKLAAEIRDRPLRTLAIAGGIGLVLGWLSRR